MMMASFGGSRNVNNFRSTVETGRLPSKESIQFEGLFAEYFFDTGITDTDKLVDAFYYCAQAPSVITGEVEKYVGISMHSSEDGKNHREPLNLVLVLDISGSMGFSFNYNYADMLNSEGGGAKKKQKVKMDIAKEVLVQIIKVMKDEERLGIVLFDNRTEILQPLRKVGLIDRDELIDKVDEIHARGGTNMEIGMRTAIEMLSDTIKQDAEKSSTTSSFPQNNRIIFLTDAHPNAGGGPNTLLGLTQKASRDRIYSSFIGVGLDFNTSMIDKIGKLQGCNYYSVNSEKQFKKILNEDFNYLVTPLCFNTVVFFESEGLEIENVYGTPHADKSTSVLTKIDTMCASAKSLEKGVKGGMILLKLKEKLTPKIDPSMEIKITLRYELPKNGERVQFSKILDFDKRMEELIVSNRIYENPGMRKVVLLAKYGQLLRDTLDAAKLRETNNVDDFGGNNNMFVMGGMIRRSQQQQPQRRNNNPLSEEMIEDLKKFKAFYQGEMEALKDPSLAKELDAIDRLIYMK